MALFKRKTEPAAVPAAPPKEELPELDFLKEREAAAQSAPAYEPAPAVDDAFASTVEAAVPAWEPAAALQSASVTEPAPAADHPASPTGMQPHPTAAQLPVNSTDDLMTPGLSIPGQYNPPVLKADNVPVITVTRTGMNYTAIDSLRGITVSGQTPYEALEALLTAVRT